MESNGGCRHSQSLLRFKNRSHPGYPLLRRWDCSAVCFAGERMSTPFVGRANQLANSPACANEWLAGVCEKPRIKCGDCGKRLLIPLSDAVIYDHLAGEHTVGVYPLLADDTCYLLAVDFDEADWRDDARAFIQSREELSVPAALEISRSGNGAHAWVFFSSRVAARDARRLGTAIISHTCSRTRQLKLESYNRLFPNQDTMPKGGFGNLPPALHPIVLNCEHTERADKQGEAEARDDRAG